MRTRTVDVARRIAATVCLVSAAAVGMTGCSDSQTPKPTPASPTFAEFNETDTDFVLAAGQSLGNSLIAAQLAATNSSNPDVQAFARDLAAATGPQVDRVASWLRIWGAHGAKFGHGAAPSGAGEPRNGLSEETMAKLTALTGARFDRLFLFAVATHLDAATRVWDAEASKGINPDAVRLAKQLQSEETEFAQRARNLLGN